MTLTPDRRKKARRYDSAALPSGAVGSGSGEAAELFGPDPRSNAPSDSRSNAPSDFRSGSPSDSRFRSLSGSAVGSSSASGAEPAVQHPLLSDEAWQDLSRIAPELTSSIESLDHLKNDLRTFDRPMGPDEAVLVVDGIETATRILESLSALALAVFERCGTPTDFGAKSTRDLVQNRLQLTGTEAARRTELAKNLGNRVGLSGQSVEPLCPAVAEGLHSGVLSAGQAAVIGECLEKLPSRFGPEVRAETERILVEHAPQVRVADLRVIFKRILDEIDPDGQEPKDPQDRSMYRVNLRSRKDGDWDLTGLLDPITGGVLHGLLTSRIQSAAERDAAASGPAAGASARADGTAAGDSAAAAMVGAGDSAGTEGARVIGATAGAADANNAPADSADRSAQEMFEIFDAVLSGDRYDAPLLPVGTAFGTESGPRGTDSRTRGTESGPRSDSSGANGSDYSAADEVPAGFGVREDGTIVDVRSEQGSVKNRIYERFSTLMSRIDMTRVAAGAPYALVVTAKADELAERKGAGVSGAETPVPITELAAGGLNGAVFFHLMSEEAKTVQVTTEKRYANAKQLAILASRDQGCTFPGCETPPGWCDAHHIVPWAEQGRTSLSNLTLTCGRHHHLIDKSDWHTVMLKDGRPAWVPPASIDPARKPILHARFIAREIIETLFD